MGLGVRRALGSRASTEAHESSCIHSLAAQVKIAASSRKINTSKQQRIAQIVKNYNCC